MSDHDTADTPARFVAWTRTPPARCWVAVATGATEAEARLKVFDIPCEGKTRDVCVLPSNIDPNQKFKRCPTSNA